MLYIFLFTEGNSGIKLTAHEIPNGYDKISFTSDNLSIFDFNGLKVWEKFTSAIYTEKDGVWEGGSVSIFTQYLKFTLFERFSEKCLEVSEIIAVNWKRTFGYDKPILFRRA